MVSYKKTCSSKSFLNFRLSSTRLLIKWFLIKKKCSAKSFLNFRLSLITNMPPEFWPRTIEKLEKFG